MCNIPASPAYGVYISQLIRYAWASSNYSDFLKRHLHLRNRLLDQGYKKIRLIRSLKKFIFHHIRWRKCQKYFYVTRWQKKYPWHFWPLYLYTFSLYENASLIIFSAETEYISTRSPASPAYGVYISQLIRYARASSNYSDFLKRHLLLRNRLLDQGYTKIRLIPLTWYRHF
jgi:hypothetical protein